MLLSAYRQGVFPWFSDGDPVLWWSPDPRFVVFLSELHVSRTTRRVVRQRRFRVTIDTAFGEVIRSCAAAPRTGQRGTWITDDMIGAYTTLHELGYAHSCESWLEDRLVGGIYGVGLGRMFFGESMFSNESNASKTAFTVLAGHLRRSGCALIDAQVYTPHVSRLGGREIPRAEFIRAITEQIAREPLSWSPGELDPSVVESAVADELAED